MRVTGGGICQIWNSLKSCPRRLLGERVASILSLGGAPPPPCPASHLPPRVGGQKGSGSWRKYIMPIRRATVRGTQQRHLPGIPWRKPHSREHFRLQKHSNLAQCWACLHLAVVKREHGGPILGTGFSPKQVHSVISSKQVHSVTLGKPFPLSGPSFSHFSHV